jgi:hypothetical protein
MCIALNVTLRLMHADTCTRRESVFAHITAPPHTHTHTPGPPTHPHAQSSSRQMDAFVLIHYGEETFQLFDQLYAGAYRADLFRLMLLYRIGGWCVAVPCTHSHNHPS